MDGDKTLVDVIRRNDYAIRFQAPDEATAKSWMVAITQAATAYRAKLESGAQVCVYVHMFILKTRSQ